MKRRLWVVAAVLVFGLLVWVALRVEPIAVETAAVGRGPLVVSLREEGWTRVRERYAVTAPLDGLLHRVTLDPGDDVRAGVTVLARIEPLAPALLDARAVGLAEARVVAAEAAVAAAREREAAAESLRVAADEDVARRVRGGDAVSAQSVADARRELLFHAGEAASARAAIAVAEADLAVARAALLAMRPPAGGDGTDSTADAPADAPASFELRAPCDGKVLVVRRESAGPVRVGDPLMELADVGELEVVADFLTSEAMQMRVGMEALALDWGGGAPLTARVRRIEPAARTKVSALGVEEQRVDVVLDLIDPRARELTLGDGYRVQVEVIVSRAADVLLVPEASLVRSTDAWTVFTVEGERARLATVQVGRRDGRHAEVLGGLAAGAEVVLFPSDRLVAGAKVRRR